MAVGAAVAASALLIPRAGHHGPGGREDAGAEHPEGKVVDGVPAGGAVTAAWVQQENAKPGTQDWRLAPHQRQGDIEGFADEVSVQRGQPVQLSVSTVAPTFHVEAYRMGYYGGAGGRLVWRSGELAGFRQPAPNVTPVTNTVETSWKPAVTVTPDATWPPGDYLFKLVGNGGQQQYVPLTVRDDTSHAAYLVQNSVTTWQAYNLWGGYDLYEGRTGKGSDFAHRARIVSFDRPYRIGDGSGDFLGSEYPIVSLLESRALDVTYTTNIDVHERPQLLVQHRAFLSLGHDEYWSTGMRDAVEHARDQGVNLAFLGANAVFRHIRLAPSPVGVDRHVVDYKSAREDPMTSKNKQEATVDWREPPLRRPESSLVGDFYECNPVKADMVVVDSANWMLEGTGLHDGDHLAAVVGSEYDRYTPQAPTPSNIEILTHSPLRCQHKASYSDSTYYTAPSGAGVFATGTNSWIAKLDPSCTNCPGPALIRITENMLAVFGVGPAGRAHPSLSNVADVLHRAPPPASTLPSGDTPDKPSSPSIEPASTTLPRRPANTTTSAVGHHNGTTTTAGRRASG